MCVCVCVCVGGGKVTRQHLPLLPQRLGSSQQTHAQATVRNHDKSVLAHDSDELAHLDETVRFAHRHAPCVHEVRDGDGRRA